MQALTLRVPFINKSTIFFIAKEDRFNKITDAFSNEEFFLLPDDYMKCLKKPIKLGVGEKLYQVLTKQDKPLANLILSNHEYMIASKQNKGTFMYNENEVLMGLI
jgi:hypothetical protein